MPSPPTDDLRPRVDLGGRTALVTGSSRGLGAATARRLGAMGADVVVTYRREEEAARHVADAVRAAGVGAWARPLDMGDVASIDELFDWIESPEGPGALDVLVANAAATSLKPLLEQQPHNVERTFAISVTGFLRAVQRAVPLMEDRGGRVVAVSGIDTTGWAPAHGLLAAAKAAMEALVHYLTCELGPRGITAVGVNPDAFFGDSLRLMLGDYYDTMLGIYERTHPLRRAATPDAVAEVVALLCTDAATWLAGNTVLADGGASFAQRGIVIGMTAKMPIDVQERMAGRDDGPAASAHTDAPSVPDL